MSNLLLALSRTAYTNEAGRSALRPIELRRPLQEVLMQNRATSFGGASGSVVVEVGPASTADRRVIPREISKGRLGGVTPTGFRQTGLRFADLWNLAKATPGLAAHGRTRGQNDPIPNARCPSPFAHSPCISSSGQQRGWLAHPCSSGAAVSQDWLHRCGARPDNERRINPGLT